MTTARDNAGWTGVFRGSAITCINCDGKGVVAHYDMDGFLSPDECPDCGGSGQNWQYPGGAVARYYSGPLLGKDPRS